MKKNSIGLALAFALVVGFTAAQVQARGGGGGHREAPRSGGGERVEGNTRQGGEGQRSEAQRSEPQRNESQRSEVKKTANAPSRTPAKAANRSNTTQNHASQTHANYSPQNKPFSAGWYASHPQAWQANHSFAGNWANSNLGAAAAWMGMAATADDSGAYSDGSTLTGDDDSGDDNSQPAATDQPQPAQNYQPLPEQASQLAQSGSELADDSNWLPLGVYALKAENQSEATAMLQLSVNKQGTLRGSYYDVVSDQGQAIQGAVDKKTRGVAWKVGSNGPVIFETPLANLTQASGPVSLYFANGQNRQWSLTRLESPAPTN